MNKAKMFKNEKVIKKTQKVRFFNTPFRSNDSKRIHNDSDLLPSPVYVNL